MLRFAALIVPFALLLCSCGNEVAPTTGAEIANQAEQTEVPPNILLFLTDDQGWNALSCLGNDWFETPRIDELAKRGALFTQSYSSSPVCTPSRAALLTGQYAPRTGIFAVGNEIRTKAPRTLNPPNNLEVLQHSTTTVAETLRANGYRTGIVGKWHLGKSFEKNGPLDHGFEYSLGALNGAPGTYFWPYTNSRTGRALPNFKEGEPGEYLTDRLTEESLKFINTPSAKPFFLYLSHFAPHSPIQAKPEYVKYFAEKDPGRTEMEATYAGMIRSLDDSVGRLVDSLKESGQLENTLIIFASDNGAVGGFLGEGLTTGKKAFTSNLPLRGGKGMLYEGGIRVPLILHWPEKIPGGHDVTAPCNTVDYYPTILAAAGIDAPENHVLDGINLLPLAQDRAHPSAANRSLFWHYPTYLGYDDKTFRQKPASVIRQGEWKLIHEYEGDRWLLFNLNQDAAEGTECGDAHPEVKARLQQSLRDWVAKTDASLPTQRDS